MLALTGQIGKVVPRALAALHDNELLIRTTGGTIALKRVVISANESPVSLEKGKKYLLFLTFRPGEDEATKVRLGDLELGKSGVFDYDSATDRITPVDESSYTTSPFVSDVLARSHEKLNLLAPLLDQRVK